MLNIVFLLDITGSMFYQLSGVKETVAQLVTSVFEEDPHDVTITIITFTESSNACYVTKHSFTDGDEAVAFVTAIQLCTPPGENVKYIGGGSNGNENQKAALAELLTLDNGVPTIAFHITDDGPHLVANPHPVSDARAEALYLKTKHKITDSDIFHVLSHVEEHFQGKLILNVVKYVKTAEHYRDHRLYGAIAKQFNGVLITPKVNDSQKLAAGLMEILTNLFASFSGEGHASVLEGGDAGALDTFSFFDLDGITTLPTCEADVNRIVTPTAGSTSEVLYQLIDRATMIVGKSFAKRAIKATGLQEQVELLLVVAKCLTKTLPFNTALDRAISLLVRIRELVPEENQGHIKIQTSDLPALLSQDVTSSASAELEAAVSAITLMSTEETVKTSLGDEGEDTTQVLDPALLLQTAGSLFLGHLAVLQLPEKNGKVDFMDSWSAVIHKVSNDVMTAADFLQMLGGNTTTRGLSIRANEYNYAQLFADPSDAVGSALLRVASGTQVLDILTGLLAGAPVRQFTPNMFRGTISACLKMLVVQPASHAPVSSYQWTIVRKLVHSIQLLMGPRPKEMKADPESPLSKLLFQLLRFDIGELESSGKSTAAVAVRAFLEEVLATLVQSMVKYREPEFLALVEGMVGYEHVDVVEDITDKHALHQDSWRINPECAIPFAATTDLSDTFQVCARNVLQTVYGCDETSSVPSLEDVWPRWQDELPKFILLTKRTTRYSLNKDATGAGTTPKSKQLEWVANDTLSQSLDSERYETLAMVLLRKKYDTFLRELRDRRGSEAAEQHWLTALKMMRAPFPEFVEKLSKVVSSSSREHRLLLKAFKLHGVSLDVADYEAKLQVVITGRLVTADDDEPGDKIVFNRGNLHPHPDRFVPMSEGFKTHLRMLQQTRQWKLSHTYRASGVPNHCGSSNSNPSAWAARRSFMQNTFWTS